MVVLAASEAAHSLHSVAEACHTAVALDTESSLVDHMAGFGKPVDRTLRTLLLRMVMAADIDMAALVFPGCRHPVDSHLWHRLLARLK